MLVKVGSNRTPVELSGYAEDVLAQRCSHDDPVRNLNQCADRTAAAMGRLLTVLVNTKALTINEASFVIGGEYLRIAE